MLKFLGSLFIVSSMTGIGIWKAEEVKHSYQALGKIYHLIGMMKNELSYVGSGFVKCFDISFGLYDHQMNIERFTGYFLDLGYNR